MNADSLPAPLSFPASLSAFQASRQQETTAPWVGSAKSAQWVVAELGAWAMLSLLALS
jgi:hypothetical protein